MTADLACAIADGGEVISDFRVLADQKELFGLVASVPTTWRTLDEVAWLAIALIAAALLSWLRLIALDGDLAKAEPKTLRYRVLHAAGKLVRGGRRRRLKIPATWPWAEAIATAWALITALPHAP